jgi:thioesterase domain-containing protein
MILANLFHKLKSKGIKLRLDEQGSIKVIGRRDQLDQEILRDLKENKDEIAKWLMKDRPNLVELKQGKASFAPLFLVHPVGGYAHCYVEFATHLNYGGPVFGLQIEGDMPDTIEKMAAKYVAAARLVQARAPYLLGGWSMGGVVAYEMTRQLNAAQEDVDLLLMIDSFRPDMGGTDLSRDRSASDEMSLLATMASELGITDETLSPAEKVALNQMPLEDLLLLFLRLGKEQSRLPAHFALSELKERFAVMLNNSSAVRRYRASPIPGEIHLIRAEENKTPDRTLGWGAMVRKVFVREQQGNHFSIMRRPHVLELAKKIDAVIQSRQAQLSISS